MCELEQENELLKKLLAEAMLRERRPETALGTPRR